MARQPTLVTHCTHCDERVGLDRHIKSIDGRYYAVCNDCSGREKTDQAKLGQLITDGGRDLFGDAIDLDEIPTGRDVTNVGLVSGGGDSTVAAAVADEIIGLDYLVYLSNETGITENEEYVRELGRDLGIQTLSIATHESYEDAVKEHGFPGPSRHGMMYIKLKERQIQKMAAEFGEVVFWTGVRRSESQRRMGNVEPVQEGRRWTWVAPIHDWTKDDCTEFIEEQDLVENDLWNTLGRSGDCFCGCFGSPEEKLDLEAAGCEEHAEWLRNLETEVAEEIDGKEAKWAWGALSDVEQRAADNEGAGQMTLCSSCGVTLPDGGEIDGAE